jgi:hypothetical protein
MPPYRIQLRGPWEFEPLTRADIGPDGAIVWTTEALPPAGRAQLPASWQDVLGDFRGRVRFRRRFHRPTNLTVDDRVRIVFEAVGGSGPVSINEHEIGRLQASDKSQAFEITRLLRGNDELVVELECTSVADAQTGLYGAVLLEIREHRVVLASTPTP